jgi:hypothetical protein
MADPLKIKVEKALNGFLGSLSALSGWNRYRGVRAEKIVWPAGKGIVVTDVTGLAPDFEERGCDIFKADIVIQVRSRVTHNSSGSAGDAETVHFTAVEAVAADLVAEEVRQFVNSENVVNRPVTGFHIGQFAVPSQIYAWDEKEQCYLTVFRFSAVVQNTDGDA